jgi:deoxyxylulose-5-phosphate synthase
MVAMILLMTKGGDKEMTQNKKATTNAKTKKGAHTSQGKKESKVDANTVAKGAAVVSLAAGAVAAGAYLSDKDNRKKVAHVASNSLSAAQDLAKEGTDELANRYQAVSMTIPSKSAKKAKVEAKKR